MKKTIKHVTIKALPKSAQPLEKLRLRGKEALSNDELLALLLGTGDKHRNALLLAKRLLKRFPAKELAKVSSSELGKIPGIGGMKAARVLASIELGERIFNRRVFSKTFIKSTEDALRELKELMVKTKEQIVVLYLNSRYELLTKEVAAVGKVNSALVEPREIIAPALLLPCSLILIAHNHPSNDPLPSEDDIEFTKRVDRACQVMGIDLVDHLIVCQDDYFSFKESSLSKASKNFRRALK